MYEADQRQNQRSKLLIFHFSQQIVTWGKIKDRPDGIKAPCAPEGEGPIPPTTAAPTNFGCAAFIRQLGLVAIETTPDGNPVPSIARNFDPLPKILDCGL